MSQHRGTADTPREKTKKKRKRQEEGHERSASSHKKHRVDNDAPPSAVHDSQAFSAPEPLDSPFHTQTSSLYLPLSPVSQLHPLEGLCAEHLSPMLLTYQQAFSGVVLSYSNPRLSEHPTATSPASGQQQQQQRQQTVLAKAVDEYAATFVWLTADFLLFKPRRGQRIEGWINLQNESHLGLVCWNLFNASIERRHLPRDWRWSDVGGHMSSDPDDPDRGQGCFIDGRGRKIDGMLSFRVLDCDIAYTHGRGFMHIEGTMLDEDDRAARGRGARI